MNDLAYIAAILILLLILGGSHIIVNKRRNRQMQEAIAAAARLAEERANELRMLKNLAETLNQTLPPEKALEAGLEQVATQVGAESGWLLTLTNDQKVDLAAGYQLPPNLELVRNENRPWALCNCMKETVNNRLTTPTLFECERLARMPGGEAYSKYHLSIPVRASGVPVGILNLVFPEMRTFREAENRLLSALGDQFGGAIERAQLFKEVHKLAITDSLTGLYNRRHFSATIQKEMERSKRYKHPLSLAILDIDHFKLINDTFGHLAGDEALQAVARICQETIRRSDLVARFGGEEMTILMPETTTEAAHQVMERLRNQVEQQKISTLRGQVQITISVGVTSLEVEGNPDFYRFLDRADQALYQAKNGGRNQVRVL